MGSQGPPLKQKGAWPPSHAVQTKNILRYSRDLCDSDSKVHTIISDSLILRNEILEWQVRSQFL